MTLFETIVKIRQSLAIGLVFGLIVAHSASPISEATKGSSVEFAPMATLRLVITPQEVTKSSSVSSLSSSNVNVLAAPTPKQATDLRAAKTSESPAPSAPTAKAASNSKCFDDLLSLSLGDDQPGSKERARKPKC
jgi:cell division septation protein DedD